MSISIDPSLLADARTFQTPELVHEIFTWLRANDPVAWCDVPARRGGGGFWSITRYDDIQAISRDTEHFSSEQGIALQTFERPEVVEGALNAEQVFAERTQGAFEGGTSMITTDPPRHTRYRRMVAPGFTPQKLDAMTAGIRARGVDILERLADQADVEFVGAVAAELPIQMLAELFAVPQEDRRKLFDWSNMIIGGEDPDIATSSEHVLGAYMEIVQYAMALRAERNGGSGRDLVSMLAGTELDGALIDDADFLSSFVLLLVAGNETTRNSISGGVLALAEHPEQRARLAADPSLIPLAVNEIVRWVTPVVHMVRTVKKDLEFRGRPLKVGDKVALWYMSGNRDEDQWDNPFEFRIDRDGPRHLAFGYGQHLCIGWHLAEIQLTVLFEELLKRYPDFEVVGPVDRMRSNFLNSIKRMTVRLQA